MAEGMATVEEERGGGGGVIVVRILADWTPRYRDLLSSLPGHGFCLVFWGQLFNEVIVVAVAVAAVVSPRFEVSKSGQNEMKEEEEEDDVEMGRVEV